jgi:hypothetical protein
MKHEAPRVISVPITKPLERLLTRAAGDRNQTAEVLARQILCDWLLADRGVVRPDGADRFREGRSPGDHAAENRTRRHA